MSRFGDLAAQDSYDVPAETPWYQPFTNVAKGLARDVPAAGRWFLDQARKPEAEAQADVRGVMGGLAEQLYTLPERTLGASEMMRTEGTYNPAPAVETALTMMGGGVAGTGEKAAMGSVLGSGPVRVTSEAAPVSQSALRAKGKAEALHGTYPQYAESYPPVGPPALMTKLPGGKAGPEVPYASMEEAMAKGAEPGFFLQKKALPEVEKFMKDRNIIQKNMDVYGYEPYFDPAKRFDVNPKNYEPFADTGTAAAPKTAKADAEWYAKYGTPENRAKLQEGFKAGQEVPESANWYHMGQLEQEYVKHLGEKKGRAAFEKEFGGMMSATTGGAAPYDNFLMAQYANVAAKQGQRLPERAYEMPSPIGGRYASGNIAQAQKYIDSGMQRFDPAQNPKRYDFASAFAGNPNAMTIDEQMYGALRPPTTPASQGVPEWYGPATRVAREEALKAGVEPRSFQDVAWAGLKKGKTEGAGSVFDYEGPMINHINRSIETTHRLTGMPRDEIVQRGLIRKEIPLYAGAGDERVAAGLQGANVLSQYKSSPGIRAYHSSPHDFDRFDLSKIGTGEGAQVYGHGLYFAENPAVSGQGGQYWDQFRGRFDIPERNAALTLKLNKFDRDAAIAEAQAKLEAEQKRYGALSEGLRDNPKLRGAPTNATINDRMRELELLQSDKPVGPRTYEVNINADPAHMLDWDKPLVQQSDIVRSGIMSARGGGRGPIATEALVSPSTSTGRDVWGHFDDYSRALHGGDRSKASAALREAGIPGIKYLDEGSRISSPGQIDLIRQNIAQREALLAKNPGNPTDTKWLAEYQDMLRRAENPTHNYVIFDPSIIDITKKYAVPGALGAGGMGALAAQDRYQGE